MEQLYVRLLEIGCCVNLETVNQQSNYVTFAYSAADTLRVSVLSHGSRLLRPCIGQNGRAWKETREAVGGGVYMSQHKGHISVDR